MKNIQKCINYIMLGIGSIGIGIAICNAVKKNYVRRVEELEQRNRKNGVLFLMMIEWMKKKHQGKNLSVYLEKKGYKEIAIYGMNYVGKALLNELQESNICIKYGIDQNAENGIEEENLTIFSPDKELEMVDAVVVTAVMSFEAIEALLKEKLDCPILSVEDLIVEA